MMPSASFFTLPFLTPRTMFVVPPLPLWPSSFSRIPAKYPGLYNFLVKATILMFVVALHLLWALRVLALASK